jgi:hypothetical protein
VRASKRKFEVWLAAVLCATVGTRALAQSDVGALYPLPTHDENWSFLAHSDPSPDFWDPVKYLSLSDDGLRYVSFGGEARVSYELFKNPEFRRVPHDDNGYSLQRFLLHSDFHLNGSIRIYVGLSSSLEEGRNGGPRPIIDRNTLDVHEAFIETQGQGALAPLSIRVGRQEMMLGMGRLVALREGVNVPLSFDGVTAKAALAPWNFTLLAVAPAQSRTGTFDDGTDHATSLFGVYVSRALEQDGVPAGALDFYYLNFQQRNAVFDQGVATEQRQMVGMRLTQTDGRLQFDDEATFQFGHFGSGDIRAWAVAIDTSYVIDDLPWRPSPHLMADAASGDKDPSKAGLETYNALYTSGAYSCRCAIGGPANNIRLEPGIRLSPTPNVHLDLGWGFFWRQSRQDALYGVGGNLIIPGDARRSRYEGSRPNLQVDWQMSRHLSLHTDAVYYINGAYGRESGYTPRMTYFSTWVAYRF